jgi:hypothetical protein
MSDHPRTIDARRPLDHGHLLRLLAGIEAGLHEHGPGRRHLAIAVEGVDVDGIEVAVRELDSSDVVGALVGLVAPDDWSAFGLVCEGRARPAVEVDGRWLPTNQRSAEAVRVGVLIDRGGSAVSGRRGERDAGFGHIARDGEVIGRVPDACRRVLGLPTPPPEVDIDAVWSICWAERVLAGALLRPGGLSWSDVVDLHPGVSIASDRGSIRLGDASRVSADVRLEIGHRLGAEITWDQSRRLIAGAPTEAVGVRPEVAAWMDDGMFSREILGVLAPLGSILVELEPIVAADVRGAIERSIRRWATG